MSAVQIPAHVAQGFLSAFSGNLAADVASKLTCSEVEALAELLSAMGGNEQAEGWIEEHTETDEPGDAHHPDSAQGDTEA